MRLKCVAMTVALFLLLAPSVIVAQDVTLTSRDGEIELSGTLLGFDGEFYRVDTIYGELTIDSSGVVCEGSGCPSLQDFVAELSISGSATMGAVLMPALVEGFAQRNGYEAIRADEDATHFSYTLIDSRTGKPAGYFYFRVSNSDEGFADLLANEADLVMSLREMTSVEEKRAFNAGMGDMRQARRSSVLALDALVPIVSPQNPVREISPLEVAKVYSGQIQNWRELGGADAPIALHAPSPDSGLGQAAVDRILEPVGLEISTNAIRHRRGAVLSEAVRRDPFALGVSSYAEIGAAQPLTLTGTCGRSLRATRRTIKTEDYPLSAPMFLYTPARRLPKVARAFLAFTQTPEAQIVIRRSGFVDQAPEEIPIDDQGNRFANAIVAAGDGVDLTELQRMIGRLSKMKRLTTSFRFEAGSVALDAQSRANIVQLAQRLEQGRYDARELLFVGFSDGIGPAEGNRAIALRRAEAVRQSILQAAEAVDISKTEIGVEAFGEALPMACDDSAWGKLTNRRVEVWVR